jgi:phosphoribosylaminoimidazolecarboxamide formyltransferase/IMP cyclohydrolase
MSTVQSPEKTSSPDVSGALPVRHALISVYDKTGVVELARAIERFGGRVLASGGTAAALRAGGVDVRSVEDYTGLASGWGGRVKTLHPKIHAGILARRDVPEDVDELTAADALPIDLVCVNLYPFEETVAAGASEEERTEKIDVGGPTMLRAAAKNWRHVVALGDPSDVPAVVAEMEAHEGRVSRATRRRLAQRAFARTAAYDAAIAADLAGAPEAADVEDDVLPARLTLSLRRVRPLRYGENPHQKAALYADEPVPEGTLPGGWRQLGGEELSYNNWIDLVAAAELALAFEEPACAVVKHTNPCGTAQGRSAKEAWDAALAADPVSAFGGIAAFNRPVDAETASALAKIFLEVVVAPAFEEGALAALAKKTRLRLVTAPVAAFERRRREWRTLPGGAFLVQEDPGRPARAADWRTVTRRAPTAAELADLEFAWKVAASVKSNAIVFVKGGRSLAVGAGQMSRVDSVRIAVMKANELGHDLAGSVVGSDAFFPFPDGPRLALEAGATAIVQPGGSKRDADTIAVCDELGAAMMFTGRRVFRH